MITHPSPGPGVPTQSAEYILGEGFADLQVGSAGAAFGFGAFGGFGGGDFGGFGGTGGAGGAGSAAAPLRAALAGDRLPPAFQFLALQAPVPGRGAVWGLARRHD